MSGNLAVQMSILEKVKEFSLKDFEDSDTYDLLQRAMNVNFTRIFSLLPKLLPQVVPQVEELDLLEGRVPSQKVLKIPGFPFLCRTFFYDEELLFAEVCVETGIDDRDNQNQRYQPPFPGKENEAGPTVPPLLPQSVETAEQCWKSLHLPHRAFRAGLQHHSLGLYVFLI